MYICDIIYAALKKSPTSATLCISPAFQILGAHSCMDLIPKCSAIVMEGSISAEGLEPPEQWGGLGGGEEAGPHGHSFFCGLLHHLETSLII